MALLSGVSARADEALDRTTLIENDIDVPGHEVQQVRVDFAPGVLAARHSHPGEEIAFVIKGTLEYKLDGRHAITLHAGESFFIPTGVPHSAKNVGEETASELATYIVRTGEKLVVPTE